MIKSPGEFQQILIIIDFDHFDLHKKNPGRKVQPGLYFYEKVYFSLIIQRLIEKRRSQTKD